MKRTDIIIIALIVALINLVFYSYMSNKVNETIDNANRIIQEANERYYSDNNDLWLMYAKLDSILDNKARYDTTFISPDTILVTFDEIFRMGSKQPALKIILPTDEWKDVK